jgi:hypothetical protein
MDFIRRCGETYPQSSEMTMKDEEMAKSIQEIALKIAPILVEGSPSVQAYVLAHLHAAFLGALKPDIRHKVFSEQCSLIGAMVAELDTIPQGMRLQ